MKNVVVTIIIHFIVVILMRVIMGVRVLGLVVVEVIVSKIFIAYVQPVITMIIIFVVMALTLIIVKIWFILAIQKMPIIKRVVVKNNTNAILVLTVLIVPINMKTNKTKPLNQNPN